MSKISEAIANADSGLQQLTISCPTYISDNTIVPRYMAGDPRNQAILIHEDGWASHATSSKHSMAPITITKACMSKLQIRMHRYILLYLLTSFQRILLTSLMLSDLYMYGMEIFFKAAVPGFSPSADLVTLRVLPLLCTADLRGHSEMALTSAGGRKGCR